VVRPSFRLANCVSVRGQETASLPNRYFPQVSMLEIQCSLRWPLILPGRRRPVRIQLEPALLRRACVIEQRRRWHRIDFRLRFDSLAAEGKPIRVDVLEEGRERSFGALEVQPVSLADAQRMRLEMLHAQNLRLWVHSHNRRHCLRSIPANSEFLAPEFTLPATPFSAFLPPQASILALTLVAGSHRQLLVERPITLSNRSLTVTGPPLRLRDLGLSELSGPCSLIVSLEGREVGVLPFRIVSQKQVVEQVHVKQIYFAAQRRNGQTARGLKVLRWEEHQAILPWVQIDVPMVSPGTTIRCLVTILHGRKVLRAEEFLLPLDRASQLMRLERLDLVALGLPPRNKPRRLTLTVHIEGEQKAVAQVVVLPPERLTNFEGQLNIEAKQLPLDDFEYDQIIHGLGVKDSELSGRPPWRKLLRLRRRLLPRWS